MTLVMVKSKQAKVNRRYRSPRRRAQAEATREAILDAAHELFLTKGYGATSIRAVAQAAEVSEQTVYNAFGDKPSLLVAVGVRVVSGALAPDLAEGGDLRAQLLATDDPLERIEIAARWERMIWEHGMLRFESMVLDAAATDPRAAEIAETTWRRKYEENKPLFAIAFPEDLRPPGDDPDEAYDLFFALGSAAFTRILIDERGWSFDDYERWIAKILRRLFTRIPDRPGP